MNGKKVATLAIEQKMPPRLPVALIAGGEWYVAACGQTFSNIIKSPQQLADIFIKGFETIGQDLLWTGAGLLNYPIHFLGCPIVDDTPASPMLSGTVITNLKELSSLNIERVTNNATMQGIIKSHHLAADAIGRETLIMPTFWGPFTTAARIIGTEKLMLDTITDPKGAKELISFSTELIWTLAEQILVHPNIQGLNISEPVASGDLISPTTFREFVLPSLTQITNRTRALNKYASLHICGNTTRILEDILIIRPDCYSLESKVDLGEARRVLGGKVCVLGNVSPTGSFLTGTAQEVCSEARQCLAAWGKPLGHILTVGCDFPNAVPLANIKALMSFQQQTF
ncbi:MAG: hypothetical protein HN417_10200 [Desulfobacula sp.]|jgi:uroporphyrinogen decarboxylase|nr:hypothetical protein [Desulfobacula sp.]MBT6338096.1 hypothetical protein [Desulfobacula sp.]MBT7259827.1 hypothetical protein [Desulfobacula sp.]